MSAPDTTETEALADWLGGQVESVNVYDPSDEATTWIEIGVDDLAQRLVSSDWLATRDAAQRAAGWDEGWNQAVASDGFPGDVNPYRADTEASS